MLTAAAASARAPALRRRAAQLADATRARPVPSYAPEAPRPPHDQAMAIAAHIMRQAAPPGGAAHPDLKSRMAIWPM